MQEYPKHNNLLKEAKILLIPKYIERQRGSLRQYLENNKRILVEEAKDTL